MGITAYEPLPCSGGSVRPKPACSSDLLRYLSVKLRLRNGSYVVGGGERIRLALAIASP